MGTETQRQKGWRRDEIKAALRQRGWSFRRLGRHYGYKDERTPGDVLRRPWPFMEKVVADILGVPPSQIWPERYSAEGKPLGNGIRGQYTKGGNSNNGESHMDKDT